MTDLRERAPGRAAMEKLVAYRGTDELQELPFGLVRIYPEALNWLRGVRGELFMAARLAKLGPAWTVLHSIPVGNRGTDIDHLVIGPPGVFPVNTKRLIDRDVRVDGSRFRSDGWKTEYLRKAAFEGDRVIAVMNRAGLTAPVLPLIAISGARSVKTKRVPHWNGVNIGVTKVEHVVKRLKRRKPVLSDEEVQRVVVALSDSTAWSRTSPSAGEDRELFRAFRKIDRGVGRVAALWLTLGGTVMIAAVWWSSSMFADYLSTLFR